MKKSSRWRKGLVLLVTVAATLPLHAQNQAQVCFYEYPYYKGNSYCAAPGFDTPDASEITINSRVQNWNNRFSSISFQGGAEVVVWEGKHYKGPSIRLSRDVPDMSVIATRQHGVRNWNDKVSSYKTTY